VGIQLLVGYVAFGVLVEAALALPVLGGELLEELLPPLDKRLVSLIRTFLRPDALDNRSGVGEERAHVGPDKLFEPVGAHAGGVAFFGSQPARRVIVAASVRTGGSSASERGRSRRELRGALTASALYLFSRHPETRYLEAYHLAWVLYALDYTNELPTTTLNSPFGRSATPTVEIEPPRIYCTADHLGI
jgi:hypothetical protein